MEMQACSCDDLTQRENANQVRSPSSNPPDGGGKPTE
jgi:hypothetical protein